MKNLISTRYSAGAFNTALLILRLGVGILMVNHGYDKLAHFTQMEPQFMNFMGLGKGLSLGLVIGAEFFCAIFLILGLFTRFACIPLIIVMCVALFKVHTGDLFDKGQTDMLFLTGFVTLLLAGPGRISADNMISN